MTYRWLLALALAVSVGTMAAALVAPISPVDGGQPDPPPVLAGEPDSLAAEAAYIRELSRQHQVRSDAKGVRPSEWTLNQGGWVGQIDDFEYDGELDPLRGWLDVYDLNEEMFGWYFWGLSDCRAANGTRSMWAIGDGDEGSQMACGVQYPNGLNSSATLRLDLTGWVSDTHHLELVFDFWLNLRTQVEDDVVPDGLFVNYRMPSTRGELDKEPVTIARLTGQWPERFWNDPWRIDLANAYEVYPPNREFNLLGMDEVDIEFLVVSKMPPGQTLSEGVFVDDVRLEGDAPEGDPTVPPSPTFTPPPTDTPEITDTPTTVPTDTPVPTATQDPHRTPTATEPTTEFPFEILMPAASKGH